MFSFAAFWRLRDILFCAINNASFNMLSSLLWSAALPATPANNIRPVDDVLSVSFLSFYYT